MQPSSCRMAARWQSGEDVYGHSCRALSTQCLVQNVNPNQRDYTIMTPKVALVSVQCRGGGGAGGVHAAAVARGRGLPLGGGDRRRCSLHAPGPCRPEGAMLGDVQHRGLQRCLQTVACA